MHELSDAEQAFVESNALYFESFGLPRIGGRILAYLLVAESPVSLDELAARLRVSKASVSTNIRHFLTIGLVDAITPLGERKTLYQWSPQAWERRADVAQAVIRGVRAIATQGLGAIAPDNAIARDRLHTSIAFADYFDAAIGRVKEGWVAHKSRPRDTPPGNPTPGDGADS